MRNYDFSPLWRSTIGFDRLFDLGKLSKSSIKISAWRSSRLCEFFVCNRFAFSVFSFNDDLRAPMQELGVEGARPHLIGRMELEMDDPSRQ